MNEVRIPRRLAAELTGWALACVVLPAGILGFYPRPALFILCLGGVALYLSIVIRFLFVKPLRVVFDFGNAGLLKEESLLRILSLMRRLHEAEGAVKALSHNHNFIETLKELNVDSFFRIHTEWSQVIF